MNYWDANSTAGSGTAWSVDSNSTSHSTSSPWRVHSPERFREANRRYRREERRRQRELNQDLGKYQRRYQESQKQRWNEIVDMFFGDDKMYKLYGDDKVNEMVHDILKEKIMSSFF